MLSYFFYAVLLSFALERGLFILYLSETGLNITDISILQISFFVSCFTFEIPTGMFADRFGKINSLRIGSLLSGISILGQYYSGKSFLGILIFFILHGLSFSFISGSAQALIYDELKKTQKLNQLTKIMGFYRFLTSASLALAMLIGPFIQTNYNWQQLYIASALLQFTAIIPSLTMNERILPSHERKNIFHGLKKNIKELLPLALPISLVHGAMTPYFAFVQKLLSEVNLSNVKISSTLSSVEIISSILVAYLSWKHISYSKIKLYILLFLFTLSIASISFVVRSEHAASLCMLLFLTSSTIVLYIHTLSESYFQSKICNPHQRASLLSFISFLDTILIVIGYLFYSLLNRVNNLALTISLSSVFPILSILLIRRRGNK